MPTNVKSLSGFNTPTLTVILRAAASPKQRVGIWIGAAPGTAGWPPNLIATVPSGKDLVEVDNPAGLAPVWAASIDADDQPLHQPVPGGQPLADEDTLSSGIAVGGSPGTSPGSSGGAGAAKPRGCGCGGGGGGGGGGGRVRIVIEIDGVGGGVSFDRRAWDGHPTTGGVPVRCMTNTGASSTDTFDLHLDTHPGDPRYGYESQDVEILYGGAPRGHTVTFSRNEKSKTGLAASSSGARSARSTRNGEYQSPAIAATPSCTS